MHKNLLILTLSLLTFQTFGQNYYEITFEGTGINENNEDEFHYSLYRDTVANPDNSWQVGAPQKSVFTEAYSVPNVIVTDTTDVYPVNDTSAFIIKTIGTGGGFQYEHTVSMHGMYAVDSDSLTDFGRIEFSPDNGITWIDLLGAEYEPYIQMSDGSRPVLTGRSFGWKPFQWNISSLRNVLEIGDTVLYRFSFITDGVQNNRDGLMFDQLRMDDYVEGIQEVGNENLIAVYPNPAAECVTVEKQSSGNSASLKIRNEAGVLIYEDPAFSQTTIDTGALSNGIYFLEYKADTGFCVKKLVVQHD